MIGPFRGALLDSSRPHEIVAPDPASLDRETWNRVCGRNANNILHVMPETYPWDPDALQSARSQAAEIVGQEYREVEGWFAYRVRQGNHEQTGLVCMVEAASYPRQVRPHEKTRVHVVPAVAANYTAVGISVNPVTLMTAGLALRDWLRSETATGPTLCFRADDGVEESVWELPQPPRDVVEDLPPAYIADGHHRAEAAAGLARDGVSPSFMAVVFPAGEMRVLGFYRVVRGFGDGEVLDRLSPISVGKPSTEPLVPGRGQAAMFAGGSWRLLRLGRPDDPRLDPELLQAEVLQPVFGIRRPGRDARLEFVPGNIPIPDLADKVDDGDYAFVTSPITVEAVLQIADEGRTVPPKSTWFSPKARAGLFIQHIGD